MDSIPGVIGKLFRRYGWLAGVWLTIIGVGFTVIGGLARYISRRMFSNFIGNSFSDMNSMFFGGDIDSFQFGNQIGNTFSGFAKNNPVSIFGAVIMVIGIIMIISGLVIALVLKKNSKGDNQ